MKLSYNQATCMKKSSVALDLDLCEKYAYDYIELRLDLLKEYLKEHSLEELSKWFQSHRLKPFALNSIEDINFCSPDDWESLLDLFQFACEVSRAIDNPYIVIVPTRLNEVNERDEELVLQDSVKVIKKLLDIAKAYGVKLAFEPIGDRHWCCNSLRQAYEIVQAVDSDQLGLVVDCINIYLHDKCADMEYLRQIPVEKIFVFHIDDCEDLPLGLLDHKHRLFPGEGVIPIRKFSNILMELGYTEAASLELFRPEYWEMDPEYVIRKGAEMCRPFL